MSFPPTPPARDKSSPSAIWHISWRERILGIQNKIIFPYLIITILVALVGTYTVTRLVAGSLQERLSNQLVESSRVASDSLIRAEQRHLETLRLMTLANSMDIAIQERDGQLVGAIITTLADNGSIPDAAVLDAQGNTLMLRGSLQRKNIDYPSLESVQAILSGQTDQRGDKYGEIYEDVFLVAGPVLLASDPTQLAGIILVGTPLETLLPNIKREALADVIFYDHLGQIQGATFFLSPTETQQLTLVPEQVKRQLNLIATQEESETLEIRVTQRVYQGMYTPLNVRGQTYGLLAVFLPSDFIVLEGGASARIFAVLFTIAALFIILMGLILARMIVRPVNRLVTVAQQVTMGDLAQRSRLTNRDEIGFLGFTFDAMTARLEERTRQLEIEAARLKSILANSQTGMAMIDRDGTLAFMNAIAFQFLQPKDDQMTLRDLLKLNPHDQLVINNFTLSTTTTRVVNESGDYLGLLVAMNDITREVRAGQLKDRFIARVSHELRTPLTVIKGYSDLLYTMIELGKLPKLDYMTGISEQTHLLDKMITELMGVAQMTSGTFTLRRQRLDLCQVLRQVIEAERTRIETAQLHLYTYIPTEPCIIQGDPQRLIWALQHLLDNAIKYTVKGGSVISELIEDRDGYYQIVITDTGVGIQEEDRPYVFDAYYRREAVTPDGQVIDPRGMGLGLYIVAKVTEAHHGFIGLNSRIGKGTTVFILLPADESTSS